ncbi:MAG: signal peptidase II [Alphaproteobacteria bacterium]|nr:signal peptidase II [Rhodospirillales bacterium]MCW9045199.1 signal peptidase II [Alphaproteobacteria bacterium]
MRLAYAFTIFFSTLAIDLTSKWFFATHIMSPPRLIPVAPFFNLVLGFNRGVSFGLFASNSTFVPYVLAAVALVVIGVLSVALWRSNNLAPTAGLAAIIGGALSNVLDRLDDGAVIDFLDFYIGQYHWPAFNFADTFIFCGAFLLLISHTQRSRGVASS